MWETLLRIVQLDNKCLCRLLSQLDFVLQMIR